MEADIMSMLDTIRDVGSWAQGLPSIPKIVISIMVILVCAFTLLLLWTPPQKITPSDDPAVKAAYERMKRVLSGLSVSADGSILVEGAPVDQKLSAYYKPYAMIEEYIRKNPGNIDGVYEIIWDNGGYDGRTIINDTDKFETLVRNFFARYADVGRAKGDK